MEFQNCINPKISLRKKDHFQKSQNVKVMVALITLLKRKPLAEITFGILIIPINFEYLSGPNKTTQPVQNKPDLS